MKRLGLTALAVVALVTMASAVVVTQEDASYAASRWASSGAVLGGPLGRRILSAETLSATNDVYLHVVRLDGGTAFVSADTELEPIVAFTTSTNFTPSADNKLWMLLKRDAIVRAAALGFSKSANLMSTASPRFATQMKVSTVAANSKWDALLEGRKDLSNLKSFGATPPNKLSGISDVRCAPLLKSQWSQTTAQGQYCYNYYTPNHDPCGCTATAMSQIMRYHEFPKDPVAAKTYQCEVDDKATALTMQGGTYDWSKMTLCPNESAYDEQSWKAIGKLTSDVGISLKSSYTSGAGSSYVTLVAKAMKEAFGYANAAAIWNWDIAEEAIYGDGHVYSDVGLHNLSVREKVIYANLDAKCPVELGIYGYGDMKIGDRSAWEGHAVVGDGYGYSEYGGEQVPYVHINLGWHGLDDAWYNVPEIYSPNSGSYVGSAGTAFTVLSAAAYNLFPTKAGNIVSGRVYDDEGMAIAGAKVKICEQGSDVVVDERVTDENGIYAFIVPGAKDYDITCHLSGSSLRDTHTITVPKDTLEKNNSQYGTYTERDANVGNYWGHDADFEITEPCVSNVTRGTSFMRVSKAFAAAQQGDVLILLRSAPLSESLTLNASFTFVATNDDPTVSAVTCADNVALTIAKDVRVLFSNVVFQASSPVVSVSAGGVAAVAGKVGLGEIKTADKNGIELAGAVEVVGGRGLTVRCLVDGGYGTQFGKWSCPFAVASANASRFANANDLRLGGHAMEGGALVWDRVVDPANAIAIGKDASSGKEKPYAYLEDALFDATNGMDIFVLKDCALEGPAVVRSDVRLACTNGSPCSIVCVGTTNATFYVASGASLAVSNLVVSGAMQDGAFVVEGGELTLEADTEITDCSSITTQGGGAVLVYADESSNPGKLTMLSGSVIRNCTAEFGYGGGVCIYDEGSSFDLFGGQIVNCMAELYGGGVYVDYGCSMRVKGDAVVKNNTSALNEGGEDNITSYEQNLELVGELTGELHVFQLYDGGTVGEAFATVADACSDLAASNSAYRIWCDVVTEGEDALHGRYDVENGVLVWDDAPIPVPVPMPDYPVAWVIIESAGVPQTNFYASVDEAFASIESDAIVEINDVGVPFDGGRCESEEELDLITNSIPYLTSSVVIAHNIEIRTTGGATNSICRADNAMIAVKDGGRLTLKNVCLKGAYPVVTYQGYGSGYYRYGVEKSFAGNTSMVKIEEGGELVMDEGAGIYDVKGAATRGSAAVCVDGGTFTMKEGSEIRRCCCTYSEEPGQEAPAGAVLVEGTFNLEGGKITDCGAVLGGGVFVDVDGIINVSGASVITNNFLLTGSELSKTNANLSVAHETEKGKNGELILSDVFTGSIGYLEPRFYLDGQKVETNVFGRVAQGVGAFEAAVGAMRFCRDAAPGVTGLAATNATTALLVWSSAATDGVYTDSAGNVYNAVKVVAVPPAVQGLVYNGQVQTGVVATVDFTLKGNAETQAGDYLATATLKSGIWDDGSTESKGIAWSIAKATYDMSGVSFTNAAYYVDGTPKSLAVSGTLPAGVSVTYVGNGQTAVGEYVVTAKFSGDAQNYNLIPDMTATLTIVELPTPPPGPDPEPTVTTNYPTAIAIQSIERLSETQWRLVITNRVPWCRYCLISTDDLSKGFTATNEWEQADGNASPAWTNDVETTGGQYFWRALGTWGIVPEAE